MPDVLIEMEDGDLEFLERYAKEHKRSRKAQIEMILVDFVAENLLKEQRKS